MSYEDFAQPGRKTWRKELRRDVRNVLGTSSDEAPTILDVLCAARAMKRLVDVASGGRFGLAIHDFRTNTDIPVADALAIIRRAKEEGSTRL